MGKKEIWLATTNKNKVQEFQAIFRDYDVKSLLDLDEPLEIEEDGTTFAENALIKARALANLLDKPAVGDDSGICVEQLDNFPGIYSRRWALPLTKAKDINEKLLKLMDEKNLESHQQRKAFMMTSIAFVNPNQNVEKTFNGRLDGYIAFNPRGTHEFGYDQIFEVGETHKTASELYAQKNKISARALAISQLTDFLKKGN